MKYALKREQRLICDRKQYYDDNDEAWTIACKLFQKSGKFHTVYKCPHCWCFHLTTQYRKTTKLYYSKMSDWFGIKLN